MKKYEKIYEDVIKTKPRSLKTFNSSHIYLPKGKSMKEYVQHAKDYAHEVSELFFSTYIKGYWLSYAIGTRKGKRTKEGGGLRSTIKSVIDKELVGHDVHPWSRETLYWLSVYIDDWFPSLINEDPFSAEKEYQYPYKHVTIDFLYVVHQMPQRAELLLEAEEKKMKFNDFCNFVVNFVFCHNDEKGKKIFTVKWRKSKGRFYIKNNYY